MVVDPVAMPMAMTPATAISHDDEAFRLFFYAEFARLAGYLVSLTNDRQLAEDFAQEALVRTWLRWRRVEDPKPYAYLVGTNLARRHFQRDARRRALLTLRPERPPITEGPDRSLRDLVERLPSRLQMPILLHYYADLPVADTARVLGVPEGSIRQRLHEGRKKLAAAYEDDQ